MNMSDEIVMWLEREKFQLEAKIHKLQSELDFIDLRLSGKAVKKCPRQYFHIPGNPIYVHGSELEPQYVDYINEYKQFLAEGDPLI